MFTYILTDITKCINIHISGWPFFDNCPDGKTLTLILPEFRSRVKLPVTWSAYDSEGNKLKIKSNFPIRKSGISLMWKGNGEKGKHTIRNWAQDKNGRKAKCQFDVLVIGKTGTETFSKFSSDRWYIYSWTCLPSLNMKWQRFNNLSIITCRHVSFIYVQYLWTILYIKVST